MNTFSSRKRVKTAFALGGLGGNNFHGLGFLHAAHKRKVFPDMISCTSGQIDVVWKFLLAKNGRLKGRYGVKSLAALAKIYHEVVEIKPRIAFPEMLRDVPDLVCASIRHFSDLEGFRRSPLGYAINATVNNTPARVLAPQIKEGTLEAIRDDFNDDDTAIAFNSYDPSAGVESVYLNPRAQKLLRRPVPKKSSFRRTGHHVTVYRAITVKGLRDALWLYEYGFERQRSIDGAYFRMVMLGELSRAQTIFVARPIQSRWQGSMPITQGERDDLKTEVFFNAAYLGERFRIELVNRHLRQHAFSQKFVEREGYHPVEIYEVEPITAQPFVEYFSEDIGMFQEAAEVAGDALDNYLSLNGKRGRAKKESLAIPAQDGRMVE